MYEIEHSVNFILWKNTRKITEIEDAATSIITNTEVQKLVYEKRVDDEKKIFDARMSEMITNTINAIKADAQTALNNELKAMKMNNEAVLKAFQEEYDQYHESYANQIIKHITEV